MNKIILTSVLIIISFTSFSQVLTDQVTGKVYRENKSNDVSGSPYLFDEWKSGEVTLSNEDKLGDVKLKFNVLYNKFLFKRNDTTYEFVDDVREIRLKDASAKDGNGELLFEKVINANGKIPAGTFVQILSVGKVTLLKHFSKRIEGENYTNGLFTTRKEMISHDAYWATVNKETVPVKLSKKSMEELTNDKQDQVNSYIKSRKLNLKNETDFAAAITYYNSISQSP